MIKTRTTREALAKEVKILRKRVAELEALEADCEQTKLKLKESEERYRQLVELSPDAILVHDSRTILYVNIAGVHLLGASRSEDLIGRPLLDIVAPEYRELVTERVNSEVERLEVAPLIEERLLRLDGKAVDVEVVGGPIVYSGRTAGQTILREITERKQTENALKESEAKFRNLADQSPNIIFIHSGRQIVYINDKAVEMTGYSKEELCSPDFNFMCLISPEFHERMKSSFAEHMKGKDVASFEYDVVRKDGAKVDAILCTKLIDYGSQQAILGIVTDISERKQIERTLSESEAKYRLITDNMSEAVMILDIEERFQFVSPSFERMRGFTLEEMKNIPHEQNMTAASWELIRKTNAEQFMPERLADKECRISFKLELEVYRKDGSSLWVEDIFTLIRDPGGRPSNILIVSRDITERKKARDALRASEETLRAMFESTTDGIVMADLDGTVRQVNQAGVTMHGYSAKDEIIGRSAFELIAEKDRGRISADFMKISRDGGIRSGEYVFLKNDGSEFPVEISAALLKDTSGRPSGIVGIVKDISERKRAAEALKHAASEWRATFDSISDLISIQDKDYRILRVNKAYAEELGMPIKDILGKTCFEIIHHSSAPKLVCPHRKTLETGLSASFESHNTNKNTYYEEFVYPVLDQQGALTSMVHVTHDITARKQAEEAIKESEERYRALVNLGTAVGEAIIVLQDFPLGEAKHTFIGDCWPAITGYSKDELLSMSFFDLVAPEGRGEVIARHRRKMAGLIMPGLYEMTIIRKDGTRVPIEITSAVTRFNGRLGNVAFIRDITERKRTERELLTQKGLIDRTLATMPDATVVITTDLHVLLANEAFSRFSGEPLPQLVGKSIDTIGCLAKLIPTIKQTMNGGVTGHEIDFTCTHEGHTRDLAASVLPMQQGEVLVVLVDITERRAKQEQLYLTNKLASIGEMAAGVAHELNNPLTSVIGLSQLLAEADLPAEVKDDLVSIHAEASRAATIVKNLLTFSRKHAPMKQAVHVESIIDDVLKLRAYEQKVNNIEVIRKYDASVPEVFVDAFQMQQVFLNIILNAEDSMKEAKHGGVLTITTETTDGQVSVRLGDTGAGIARENLEKLFTPFFTTKEVGKGTGLGLSITFGIIAEHGGRIWAESDPGEGATFIVELPINIGQELAVT